MLPLDHEPWDVNNGSEKFNGTFNMMGNVWEWMENSYSGDYLFGSSRVTRGGSFVSVGAIDLSSPYRTHTLPDTVGYNLGFRVTSEILEPVTLLLLGLDSVMVRKKH